MTPCRYLLILKKIPNICVSFQKDITAKAHPGKNPLLKIVEYLLNTSISYLLMLLCSEKKNQSSFFSSEYSIILEATIHFYGNITHRNNYDPHNRVTVHR